MWIDLCFGWLLAGCLMNEVNEKHASPRHELPEAMLRIPRTLNSRSHEYAKDVDVLHEGDWSCAMVVRFRKGSKFAPVCTHKNRFDRYRSCYGAPGSRRWWYLRLRSGTYITPTASQLPLTSLCACAAPTARPRCRRARCHSSPWPLQTRASPIMPLHTQ